MKTISHTLSRLALIGLLSASPWVLADHVESYGDIVGRKALTGLANLTTAPLEIPKSVVNVNNQSNFAYGFVGGTLLGIVNTAGRIGIGLLDLVSAPIPTQPIVYPTYVWDDFDAPTQYGPALRPQPHQ